MATTHSSIRRLMAATVGALVWLASTAAVGPPPNLTPQQRAQLRERNVLWDQARSLSDASKYKEAEAALRKALPLEESLYGVVSAPVSDTYHWLAWLGEKQGKWPEALGAAERRYRVLIRLHGADHWRAGDGRRAARDLRAKSRMTKDMLGAINNADAWDAEIVRLTNTGKAKEAVKPARLWMLTRQLVQGADHHAYATAVHNLARATKHAEGDRAALPLFQQGVELRKAALGERHPLYAESLHSLALCHAALGDRKNALAQLGQALAAQKAAEGANSLMYATYLTSLGQQYQAVADFRRAVPLLEEAVRRYRASAGEWHYHHAVALRNLGTCLQTMGEHRLALGHYHQSREIIQHVFTEKHPQQVLAAFGLAWCYHEMGDYQAALPRYQQYLELVEKVHGQKHPSYAAGLNNLGLLYMHIGDLPIALRYLKNAAAATRAAVGDKHVHYATRVHNLATAYHRLGDARAALPLIQQAEAIRKEKLGERNVPYANTQSVLAGIYSSLGDDKRAVAHYEKALKVFESFGGQKHPSYASNLTNLARQHRRMGDLQTALKTAKRAVAQLEQGAGEGHPFTANARNMLALLYHEQGDAKEARAISSAALRIVQRHLEDTSSVLPEAQQLSIASMMSGFLNTRLTFPVGVDDRGDYDHLLAFKGAVFLRQHRRRQFQRVARESKDAEVLRLTAALESTARQLAVTAFSPVTNVALTRQRLADLTKEKEALEAELSRRSAAFRRLRESQRLSPAALQKLLPEGVALIDYHEYTHIPPIKEKKPSHRRLTAFVVRKDVLARVDLGEMAGIVKDIAAWRGSIERRVKPCEGKDDPAHRLREKLWRPLQKHLRGAKTVLVSPDGALARLPFAALPGSKDEVYLIEELVLATLPVPQLLPEALAPLPAPGKKGPSLLLVGDVDHDDRDDKAAPGPAESKRGPDANKKWQKLQETRAEAAAIRDSFEDRHDRSVVTFLRREKPTTAAVREAAPSHRFLHLATHGFFTPKETRSALTSTDRRGGGAEASGWHPGLLSGLVLAGANKPTERDTGILTALEVAELDLSGCELAVLSACETGLGEVAGGEGVLGLQRAFQVAGARATVCSLWEVGDQATRQLMVAFYARLWGRKQPLGKAEALAEAQRLMLKEGLKRNMVRKDKVPQGEQRVPPFFWAAFVVAGDWR